MSMKEIWIQERRGFPQSGCWRWTDSIPDAHIAWGFGIPSFFGWAVGDAVLGAVLILVIAFLKEYFADPYYEGNPFLWNGVEDLAEYTVAVIMPFALASLLSYSAGYPFHWNKRLTTSACFGSVFSIVIFTPSAFAFGTTTLFKKSIISLALTHASFNTPLSTNHCIPQALLFQIISLSLGPESEEQFRIPPGPGSLRKRSRCPPNQKYQVMNKLCFSPLPLEQASSRSSQA